MSALKADSMFMQTIPTYLVEWWNPGGDAHNLFVERDHLMAVIHSILTTEPVARITVQQKSLHVGQQVVNQST